MGSNYWAVGDTKKIVLNGKVSDGLTLNNFETYVYIIGFNHNEALEGKGITFQGFKTAQTGGTDICLVDSAYYNNKTSGQWFNMNNSDTNVGGWKDSLMRTVTMPLIRSALPSDLSSIIKPTYKYTDNVGGDNGSVESNVSATQDDIFLLGEYEIYGVISYSNSFENNKQTQYNYYVLGNSKIKYKHSDTVSSAFWWGRSPRSDGSYRFCFVSAGGGTSGGSSSYSLGVAPAFKI